MVTHEGPVLGQTTLAKELCRSNTLPRERSIAEYGYLSLLAPSAPLPKTAETKPLKLLENTCANIQILEKTSKRQKGEGVPSWKSWPWQSKKP